jgi:hypothetical protein
MAQWAATAAFALAAVACSVAVSTSAPSLRTTALLWTGGLVLFRALAAYGVWYRTRWGAWLGGVLATFSVLLFPLLAWASVQTPSGARFESTPLSVVLAWLQVAANAAFLLGLFLVRRERRA